MTGGISYTVQQLAFIAQLNTLQPEFSNAKADPHTGGRQVGNLPDQLSFG